MQAEDREAGEVDGGGEPAEVVVDPFGATDACVPAAVLAPQQMTELALDLRPRRPVVRTPRRIGLLGTRGNDSLIWPHLGPE